METLDSLLTSFETLLSRLTDLVSIPILPHTHEVSTKASVIQSAMISANPLTKLDPFQASLGLLSESVL